MKHFFFSYSALACFLMMIIFFSCSKDEDDYTPTFVSYQTTTLFEVPYTQFGSSREVVKAALKNKTIKEESDDKIVYKGESEGEFQVYYFELGKLVESATFIKAKYEDYFYTNAMKKQYTFWGDTRGPISTFYGYVYTVYYYVAMTKQSSTVWMIDYIAHDRVNYSENHSGGGGTKQINLPGVIKAKEYLPY